MIVGKFIIPLIGYNDNPTLIERDEVLEENTCTCAWTDL